MPVAALYCIALRLESHHQRHPLKSALRKFADAALSTLTRHAAAAGFVILLYDHLLTFEAETADTIGPVGSGLSNIHLTDATYAGWVTIGISNFLVLLRIWAILPHGHRLRAWSIVFFVASQLTSFAVTSWVIVANMIPVLIFDPLVALCSFSSKPNVVGLWVIGLVFEVVVFLTFILTSNKQPTDPIRFIWCGTTVTTTRLIINSRRTAAKEARLRELRMSASYGQQCDPDCTSDTFSESRTEMLPRRSR
ncbi:hypothetical protein B0H11DRAFT_2398030 [Mycena galericulata]|nr:hypothetical protein B0H11DRAFT_2398030 [Mycena galericulata]